MYIFYDTETTGLDKDFSQILQIAMVFTDDNLNILSSKKLECRRSPWVIPTPGAMLTTGFVPDDLKNNPYTHFEMMREVNAWARSQHWPLIYSGYNTLGYDEPVLAQNFSQNLMHNDLTTAVNNKNGLANGRSDILTMVRAAMLYAPGALKLDIKNGFNQPSLTLGNVARQNGVTLSEEDAHDAMNDIKATIGVAKAIMKSAPAIWEQLTKMATVSGVDEFLNSTPVFTFTSIGFGKPKSYAATSVTVREGSDTQVLFDLSIDPAPFIAMTQDEITQAFRDRNDKTNAKPQPFILTRKNAQPVLMPLDQSDNVLPATFDETQAAERAALIKANPDFIDKVAKAALIVKNENPRDYTGTLPEQQMDKEVAPELQARIDLWMHEFHNADTWKASFDLVNEFYVRFEEEIKADETLRRFPKFAGRIVFEHAPEEIDEETQDRMRRYIAARVLNPDPKAPYMTIPKARKELEQIENDRANGKEKWQEVTDTQIRSLKLYYTSIEKEYAAYAPEFPDPAVNNPPSLPQSPKGGHGPKNG